MESYGFVTVSSSLSDTNCNPYSVVDPNGMGFWAPPVDIGHASYELIFERAYTVEKVVIKWKLKPPKAEILLLTKSFKWKVMMFEEPTDDIEMHLVPMEIMGLKVIMLDMLEGKKPDSDPIYGIKKI